MWMSVLYRIDHNEWICAYCMNKSKSFKECGNARLNFSRPKENLKMGSFINFNELKFYNINDI